MFNSLVNIGRSVLVSVLSKTSPDKVIAFDSSNLSSRVVIDREECMVLYGPVREQRDGSQSRNENDLFEIVVYSTMVGSNGFSIHRTKNEIMAIQKFSLYRNHLPLLLDMDSNLLVPNKIKSICEKCEEHCNDSNYTALHLAVELNLYHVADRNRLLAYLDTCDTFGVSPIMMAISASNTNMVKLLLSKGAHVNNANKDGNTIFHYAANSNQKILNLLINYVKEGSFIEGVPNKENDEVEVLASYPLLNKPNVEGNTPLHIAVLNDNAECLAILVKVGADLSLSGTTDGTPLHYARSKPIIDILLSSGVDINAKDFNGDTALHKIVKHELMSCLITLLTNGSDVNSVNHKGNSALHVAIKVLSPFMVKGLLVFGADPNIPNLMNETVWMCAMKKMTECEILPADTKEDTALKERAITVLYYLSCVGIERDKSMPPSNEEGKEIDFSSVKKAFACKRSRYYFDEILKNKLNALNGQKADGDRLLCMDGGGIKGLVLLAMLKNFELVWKTPIQNCFDWIAGTSTGGILALALSTGKSLIECQNLYFKLKDLVFLGSKPHDTKALEKLLLHEFGNLRMSDIKYPKVVVTATMADRMPPDLYLFRNYQSSQELLKIIDYPNPQISNDGLLEGHFNDADELVWKAARATGAAPSYFRPDGKYVDGAIMANNPTLVLLTEISEYNYCHQELKQTSKICKPKALISLGTGIPPVMKASVADIFRPDSVQDTLKLFLNWDGMGKMILESLVDSNNRIVDQSRAWCRMAGITYHRFSPYLEKDVALDEVDDNILIDIMFDTMIYMHERREDVRALRAVFVHEDTAGKGH